MLDLWDKRMKSKKKTRSFLKKIFATKLVSNHFIWKKKKEFIAVTNA